MGVPTFCPIHMKIHECPENSNKAISSANETKIKAKMARMLNPTTTTESEKTQQAEKGTIQYILENAKKNNSTIKNKLGIESEAGRSVGIDENDIKAKMARLRASVNGIQSTTNSESTSPTPNQQGSGLQEIIDHAYRVNRGIERIKSPEEEKLTVVLTTDEIEDLIEKAVIKAMAKEKDNKKKRSS